MRSGIVATIFCVLTFSAASALAQEWKVYKRQHFIINYKKAPLDFVETVEEAAEGYYVEIANNLGFTRYKGWSWENRATIYIYDDADDYVESGKQAGWSHGVASPEYKTIHTFPSAHGFFDSTLPHELGHIIFREFIGFKAQVPAWFEEGVAMYQEKAKRWGADETVRQAMSDGSFKPLGELTLTHLRNNMNRDVINLFYAESASIVHFMINELGEQRFVYFCRKLKDDQPFAWALGSVYTRFKSIDDLNDAWIKHLNNE